MAVRLRLSASSFSLHAACVTFRRLVVPLMFLVLPGLAFAQSQWPTQPIRMVVPFPPGGSADVVARAITSPLAQSLGQPVTVENRPGDGGVTGTDLVANAPADGYTWGIVNDAFAASPALRTQLPYRTPEDFQLVSLIGTYPYVLVAPAGGPSLAQMIASARTGTGLTVGTPGLGNPHLALAHIAGQNRLQISYVPYKGTAALLADLGRGNLPVGVMALSSPSPAGVRVVAVTGSARNPLFPEAPTLAEAGLSGADQQGFIGIVVPRATPQSIVNRIRADVRRALSDGAVAHALQSRAIVGAAGADFASLVQQDLPRFATGARIAGVAGANDPTPAASPSSSQPDNTTELVSAVLGAMAASQQSRQRANAPQQAAPSGSSSLPVTITPQPRNQTGSCRTEVSVGYSTTYCPDGTVTRTQMAAGQSSSSGGQSSSSGGRLSGSDPAASLNQCVQVIRTERGAHCGSRTSLVVELRNTCNQVIKTHICLEQQDRRAHCGANLGVRPGEKSFFYTCNSTGRYRYAACMRDTNGNCTDTTNGGPF